MIQACPPSAVLPLRPRRNEPDPDPAATVPVPIRPPLYAPQAHGVDRFLNQPRPRRLIFAWGTGCGKTAGALTILRGLTECDEPALPIPKTLVVTPAIVRHHWRREMETWCRGLAPLAAIISQGRQRKLSTRATERRNAAYAAHIQIVSYDLLREVDLKGWDLIILDELHHLAHPLSQQSKRTRDLLDANPFADVLGLSATLIPTEAKQIWNPLRLLFGEHEWGPASSLGGVSWRFLERYCHMERNEFGTSAWGCRDDRRSELKARLQGCTHALTREEIIPNLPPLDLHVLELGATQRSDSQAARLIEWATTLNADATHLVVLSHTRALAGAVWKALREDKGLTGTLIAYVDGTVPPERRVAVLAQCASAPRTILVGTHDSLNEGVRLMWANQVAIAEWGQSPGKVVQLLGRFSSVGDTVSRPCVNLIASSETWAAAQQLLYRTRVTQDLLKAGQVPDQLTALLTKPNATEDELADAFKQMMDGAKASTDDESGTDSWLDEEAER